MITPLIENADWLSYLETLPEWNPPNGPVLILSPHPDDETLGAGGLLATLTRTGIPARVIAVTEGEHAYEDIPDLGAIRAIEQTNALTRLGVSPGSITRLRIPDTKVADHEDEMFEQLLYLVTSDCHIVAPWTGDYHPDHEACGRVARRLAEQCGASVSFYFFWTWHRGTPNDIRATDARIFCLDLEAIQAKTEALECHRSQLHHPSGEPILPSYLLGPMGWPFEVYLPS